jgi:hypothetical protein
MFARSGDITPPYAKKVIMQSKPQYALPLNGFSFVYFA